jgi:hypothetical protein
MEFGMEFGTLRYSRFYQSWYGIYTISERIQIWVRFQKSSEKRILKFRIKKIYPVTGHLFQKSLPLYSEFHCPGKKSVICHIFIIHFWSILLRARPHRFPWPAIPDWTRFGLGKVDWPSTTYRLGQSLYRPTSSHSQTPVVTHVHWLMTLMTDANDKTAIWWQFNGNSN